MSIVFVRCNFRNKHALLYAVVTEKTGLYESEAVRLRLKGAVRKGDFGGVKLRKVKIFTYKGVHIGGSKAVALACRIIEFFSVGEVIKAVEHTLGTDVAGCGKIPISAVIKPHSGYGERHFHKLFYAAFIKAFSAGLLCGARLSTAFANI